jgi:hypothetical protein
VWLWVGAAVTSFLVVRLLFFFFFFVFGFACVCCWVVVLAGSMLVFGGWSVEKRLSWRLRTTWTYACKYV